MAFFQDLGKKITEGVHEASEKASEMVEITKINSAIAKEKDAINEAKQLIGDKVYGMFKAGTALPEGLAEEFQNIDTHLQKIAEFETKIASLKE